MLPGHHPYSNHIVIPLVVLRGRAEVALLGECVHHVFKECCSVYLVSHHTRSFAGATMPCLTPCHLLPPSGWLVPGHLEPLCVIEMLSE